MKWRRDKEEDNSELFSVKRSESCELSLDIDILRWLEASLACAQMYLV